MLPMKLEREIPAQVAELYNTCAYAQELGLPQTSPIFSFTQLKGKKKRKNIKVPIAEYLPTKLKFCFCTHEDTPPPPAEHPQETVIYFEVGCGEIQLLPFDLKTKLPPSPWMLMSRAGMLPSLRTFRELMREFAFVKDLAFDFGGLKQVKPEIVPFVATTLDAIYGAFKLFSDLEHKNLANSLSYNLSRAGSRVEELKLKARLRDFIARHPLLIAFKETSGEESAELMEVTEKNLILNCSVGYAENGTMRSVNPLGYSKEMYERLEKEVCLEEIGKVKKAAMAQGEEMKISVDEKRPLRLGYVESIALLTSVCKRLFQNDFALNHNPYYPNSYLAIESASYSAKKTPPSPSSDPSLPSRSFSKTSPMPFVPPRASTLVRVSRISPSLSNLASQIFTTFLASKVTSNSASTSCPITLKDW